MKKIINFILLFSFLFYNLNLLAKNTLIFQQIINNSTYFDTTLQKPYVLINSDGKDKLFFIAYGSLIEFDGKNFKNILNTIPLLKDKVNNFYNNYNFAYVPEIKKFIISFIYTYYENTEGYMKANIFFINEDGGYEVKDLDLGEDGKVYKFYRDDNGTLYLCNYDNKCYFIINPEGDLTNFGKTSTQNLNSLTKENNIIEYDENQKIKIIKNDATFIVSPIDNYNYSDVTKVKYLKNFKMENGNIIPSYNTVFENNNKISFIIPIFPTYYSEDVPTSKSYILLDKDLDQFTTDNLTEIFDDDFKLDISTLDAKIIDFSKTSNGNSIGFYPIELNNITYLFGIENEKKYNFYQIDNDSLKIYTALYPLDSNNFAFNGKILAWPEGNVICYYNKDTEELKAVESLGNYEKKIYNVLNGYFLILNSEYEEISPKDNPDCQSSSCYKMIIELYDPNMQLVNREELEGYYISNPWGTENIFPYDMDNNIFCIDYQDMTSNANHHFYCYDKELNLKYKFDGEFLSGVFHDNYFVGNSVGTGEIINLSDNNVKYFAIDNYLDVMETPNYVIFAGRTGGIWAATGYEIIIDSWDKFLNFNPSEESIEGIANFKFISDKSIGAIFPITYNNYLYLIGENFNKNEDYTIIKYKIDDNGTLEKLGEYDLNNYGDPQNLNVYFSNGSVHFIYGDDNKIYEINLSNNEESFNYNIQKGWNLFGNPFISEISINAFDNDSINTVWKWENNKWKIYSPNPNLTPILEKYNIPKIEQLNSSDGFWVNANNPINITIYGTFGNINNILEKIINGWSLLGSGVDIDENMLNNYFKDVKTIWVWNSNKWEIWTPDDKLKEILDAYNLPFLTNINKGKGFWVNK